MSTDECNIGLGIQVRAILCLKNEKMLAARERLGLSQKSLSDLSEVPLPQISAMESLNFDFYDVEHRIERVAGALELSPKDICPDELFHQKIESRQIRKFNMPLRQLVSMATERMALPAPEVLNPDGNNIKEKINAALHTLTYREREVLKSYFGLEGSELCSMSEIARKFGVTRSRMDKIYKKAIRKLKNPCRAKMIDVEAHKAAVDDEEQRRMRYRKELENYGPPLEVEIITPEPPDEHR